MTREKAREAGLKVYFDGKPCPRGHISSRNVKDNDCRECGRLAMAAWREKNRERFNSYARQMQRQRYRERGDEIRERDRKRKKKQHGNNPSRFRAACKRWQAKNPGRQNQYSAKAYQRTRSTHDERTKQWYRDHPEIANAKNARRRAALMNATPAWLTRDHLLEIQKFYRDAQRKARATGIEHHVDHIVPLKSSIVCGLHVPWNLQVLTGSENSRKRNKLTIQ